MEAGVQHGCGLIGVFGHREAARLTYLGLCALQHRGEEAAGIASSDGAGIHAHKGSGLVSDVFGPQSLRGLTGRAAIGHTRYSTTGSSTLRNSQPLVVTYAKGPIAVAHNGNIVNAFELRRELEAAGSIFQTTVDSEIILHLLARSTMPTFVDDLSHSLKRLQGAYSLVFLTRDAVYGCRDPNGFRPLCIGRLNRAFVLASETCALDLIGARLLREVEPGEVVAVTEGGLSSHHPFPAREVRPAHCLFEHVYFSRPDSVVFGESVQEKRIRVGRRLAIEHPVAADLVIPIPDSGVFAALGYSQESGIPYGIGVIRNHYVGRTFIQPVQGVRDLKVRIKFNPVREVVAGKRLVVVDDSIVRGTTLRARVKSLRDAGAREIHLRISCPPTRFSCFYGIDFPTRGELIANTMSLEEIRRYLGADTLGYVSLEGLQGAESRPGDYCTACWSGSYPVPYGEEGDKFAIEKHAGEAGGS